MAGKAIRLIQGKKGVGLSAPGRPKLDNVLPKAGTAKAKTVNPKNPATKAYSEAVRKQK